MSRRPTTPAAVVTGTGDAVSREIAQRLAADGVRVAVAELDPERTGECRRERHDDGITTYRAELTDPASVAALAVAVRADLGPVQIVVNAAESRPAQAWNAIEPAQWRRVLAVNLDAVFLVSRAFVPGMLPFGWGRVVNLASSLSRMAAPELSHYVAAKMGVIGYTRALGTELGPHGVTVNAVSPSVVGDKSSDGRDSLDSVIRSQIIGRRQTPLDVAGAVSFLTSRDADFITCQTLQIDGGLIPV